MKAIISLGRGMTNILLFYCLFLGNIHQMSAQGYLDICASEDSSSGYIYFDNDPQYLNNLEPLVLNIYFWGIRDSYGVPNSQDLTEQKALEAIQNLNINFNPYQIYFKYRGFSSFDSPADVEWLQFNYDCPLNGKCVDYPFETDPSSPNYCINSPQIYNIDPDGFGRLSRCQRGALITYGQSMGYIEPNAINIYVPRGTTDFGGSGGNPIILPTSNLEGNTLIHEMGHYFGLPHTFNGWNSSSPSGCEHVTRDSNNPCDPNANPNIPCYNANARGDYITDTAAMPEFRREYCTLNGLPASQCNSGQPFYYEYYDITNCEYIGTTGGNTRTDCQGTFYQIDALQSQNYMSYAPGLCMSNFTTEQVFKMRTRITNYMQDRLTTLAALYEPYAGGYYLAGPYDSRLHTPLFQPGFDYRFVECDCACPQPIEYNNLNFTYNSANAIKTVAKNENDFSKIWHPNHTAIEIDLGILPNPVQTTQRCYDNNNKAPSGGSITRFNDGVFNTNVTITPQDSTGINNPNLINNLQPGLYNIKKDFIDGNTEENVVLKQNN